VKLRSVIRRLATIALAASALALAFEAMPASASIPDGDAGVVTDAGASSATPEAIPAPAGPPDGGARPEHRRLKRVRGSGVPMTFQPAALPSSVVAPPAPPPEPDTPPTSVPISDLGFNTCHKIPADRRAVRVTLKPDIELPALVAWISSVTCDAFVLPGHLGGAGKKITLVTRGTLTPREAYDVFLSALDSVGLTVEPREGFLTIIEAAKAKMATVPVYGFDGRRARER
jgi:hypothetical protein